MRSILLALGATALLLAGCKGTGSLGGDRTEPLVTLTALNADGAPSFRSNEGDVDETMACAVIRRFPSAMQVTATDSGNIARLQIEIYPSKLRSGSVVVTPSAPQTEIDLKQGGSSDRLIVYADVGSAVRTAIIDFDVIDKATIVASAIDLAGNVAQLYAVRLYDGNDPVTCRQ